MVVEDDPELLGVLEKLFADFKVVCVETLSEAHAVLQRSALTIDVVIIDYRLPDGTADHLLDALADRQRSPAVVLISADDGASRAAAKFDVTFVRKPFDVDSLFDTVALAHDRRARPVRA